MICSFCYHRGLIRAPILLCWCLWYAGLLCEPNRHSSCMGAGSVWSCPYFQLNNIWGDRGSNAFVYMYPSMMYGRAHIHPIEHDIVSRAHTQACLLLVEWGNCHTLLCTCCTSIWGIDYIKHAVIHVVSRPLTKRSMDQNAVSFHSQHSRWTCELLYVGTLYMNICVCVCIYPSHKICSTSSYLVPGTTAVPRIPHPSLFDRFSIFKARILLNVSYDVNMS